jgi:hypothetical protein
MQHDPGSHARAQEVDETAELLLSEMGSRKREKSLRFDLHSHILPKQWPSLSEKYGEGPWIQLQHTREGYANMMRSGKVSAAVAGCECVRVADNKRSSFAKSTKTRGTARRA